jgi:alginate O-acetyltransferase complex protein AlgI
LSPPRYRPWVIVAGGSAKRYQQFLPKLRAEPAPWAKDWHRGVTRILADLAVANRAILRVWLLAYGIKI